MICPNCQKKIGPREFHIRVVDSGFVYSCSPKAERSEVLQGCPPSATGSADARAADEAAADSSGRSADAAVQPWQLMSAARALCKKMDMIHDNPLYQAVWTCAWNHGVNYTHGPTYELELKALKAAVKSANAGSPNGAGERPQASLTRKDVIEALRGLYGEWRDLKSMADGCSDVRLPDYEAMLDELEKTGMPTK